MGLTKYQDTTRPKVESLLLVKKLGTDKFRDISTSCLHDVTVTDTFLEADKTFIV